MASKQDFMNQYASVAQAAGKELGVSPDALLAQWGLETGFGKSIIPGTNNLGNIKDFSKGSDGVRAFDKAEGSNDKYRKYATPEDFAKDYVSLIQRKYPQAMNTGGNVQAFASALKAGGYATDPNYVQKLVSVAGSTYTPTRDIKAPVGPSRGLPEASTQKTWTPGQPLLDAEMNAALTGSAYDVEQATLAGKTVAAPSAPLGTYNANANDAAAVNALSQAISDNTIATAPKALGFVDSVKATIDLGGISSPTMALIDKFRSATAKYDSVPFLTPENYHQAMVGLDDDEQDFMMANGAKSEDAWNIAMSQVQRKREAAQALAANGSWTTTAGLAVGIADPSTLLLGFGAGKALALAGYGSQAALASGRVAKGLASAAGENAAVSLAVDAGVAASGNHMTVEDVVAHTAMAAAGGAALIGGIHFASPYVSRFAKDEAGSLFGNLLNKHADDMTADANLSMARQAADWEAAAKQAGPDADTVAIQRQHDINQKAMDDQFIQKGLAPAPESRRSTLTNIGEDVQSFVDSGQDGLDLGNTRDSAIYAGIKQNMTRITEVNGVDADRFAGAGLSKINKQLGSLFKTLYKAGGLESNTATMLQSESTIARGIGTILGESSSGATARGTTVGLQKFLTEHSMLRDFDVAFADQARVWSRQNGGSYADDFLGGEVRAKFDRAVYDELQSRFQAKESGLDIRGRQVDPAISRAADLQEMVMDRARRAQQAVEVKGAKALGDDSVGYLPQHMDALKVFNLKGSARTEVAEILSQQLQTGSGYSKEFSDRFAKRWINEVRNQAVGGKTTAFGKAPSGSFVDDLSDAVREAEGKGIPTRNVESLKAGAEQKVTGKAQGHTFHRTRLDMTSEYTLKDGSTFRMGDIFDNNVESLTKRYVRRVSGEVALHQHGIPGANGLRVLRAAMIQDGALTPELDAFDSMAGAIMGTPRNAESAGVVRATQATQQFTTLLSMGGMGVTQAGETLNATLALGFTNTLKSLPEMRAIYTDAIQMIKTGESSNPILKALDPLAGGIGMESYFKPLPFAMDDNLNATIGVTSTTKVEKALRVGAAAQAKLSFHRAITMTQRRLFAQQMTAKVMSDIKAGKGIDATLKDIGITPELHASLTKHIDDIATFKDGRLVALDVSKLPADATLGLTQAIQRSSAQIIQDMFVGETGTWMDNSWGRLLGQFRGFGIASVEKQFGRQVGAYGLPSVAALIGVAMPMVAPIYITRTIINAQGKDNKDEYIKQYLSPTAIAIGSMNYLSVMGLMPDLVALAAAPTFGLDIGTARGAAGGLVGAVPSVGTVNKAYQAATSVLSAPRKLATGEQTHVGRDLLNLTPMGRLPYLIPLLNAVKSETEQLETPEE